MTQHFSFKNSRTTEINDLRCPLLLPLDGYRYELTIKPNCSFWRIGLRLWMENRAPGYSTSHRYNNPHIRHIEICAGIRSGDAWQHDQLLQLQQYHFPNTESTLASLDFYKPLSTVKIELTPIPERQRIEIKMLYLDLLKIFEVEQGFYKSFQIWGWADYSEFDIDCEIFSEIRPLKIDLDNVKALSLFKEKQSISIEKLTVFFGGNNCGKTSLLVAACNSPFNYFNCDYIGLNRVHSNSEFDIKLDGLSSGEKKSRQEDNMRKRTKNSLGQNEQFDWMKELALQDEETRSKIFEWVEKHFARWELKEEKTGKYTTGIKPIVNQRHPLDQGTGVRAVLPIITQLFNPNVDVLAIDEPELGLEPRMQKEVFKAVKDATEGINGFPLKRVLLATHSHLFLDREEVRNNLSVQKIEGLVNFQRVTSSDELQSAIYTLLGGSPSDLFFPSNVIIVEGKSDHDFFRAIYSIGLKTGIFVSRNLAFHYLEGFDKLSYASEAIVQMLKTQSYSPVYKDKICGLFDKTTKGNRIIDKARDYFNDHAKERFVLLDKLAIEYYYPISVINRIFKLNISRQQYSDEVVKFLQSGQLFSRELSKVELVTLVTERLTSEDFGEVDSVILNLLKKADELAYK